MKNKWVIPGVLLLIAGVAFAYFMYNKPHKDIESSSPDFELTPEELIAAYDQNEDDANVLYLDKVIQISGKVKEKMNAGGTSSLMIETGSDLNGIICEFQDDSKLKDIQIGDIVKVRGVCSGKLIDIVLVRSIIIDN